MENANQVPDWAAIPTLDRQVLDELRQYSDDEQDLVQDLITLFLQDSPAQLIALQSALRNADANEAEHRSHRLKGSAGSIGAIRLREICQHIEESARRGAIDEGIRMEPAITDELGTLKAELQQIAGGTT